MSSFAVAIPSGILQVHHLATATSNNTPLVCLPPAPMDGSYFAAFAGLLSQRDVYAVDYPGYGDSTHPAAPPAIDDYAEAIGAALAELLPGQSVHLLGFHTGCLVACEMALRSQLIGRLILIDAPYFSPAEQQQKYAAEMVADDPTTWGFGAAFSYPCEARVAQLDNRALAVATASTLRDPTHAIAAALSDCHLEDCPDVRRPAFQTGGAQFAKLITGFLRN